MKIKDSKTARFLATSLTTGLAASAGNAATVQITLIGNNFSTTTGNQLNADITGDLMPDIAISDSRLINSNTYKGVLVTINGSGLSAVFDSASIFDARAAFPNAVVGWGTGPVGGELSDRVAFNPITFTDARINGGAVTQAYLQVEARNFSSSSHEISLLRVIFDDASTTRPTGNFAALSQTFTEFSAVPEPSGLSLLALGAGGLLARRRRLAA